MENWAYTDLGKEYDIYEEDGEKAQQYQTDTGPLDILAISKDRKTLLVVELKKGRASDAVVGQTLRYMSFVNEMLAEDDQIVQGVIIALEDDASNTACSKYGADYPILSIPNKFQIGKDFKWAQRHRLNGECPEGRGLSAHVPQLAGVLLVAA